MPIPVETISPIEMVGQGRVPETNATPHFPDQVSDDWLLWQLADSAFPTGGFAHSGGLEAAWQHQEVRNSGELDGFIRSSLSQVGRGSMPFMTATYDAPERFAAIDKSANHFLTNHVANRASRLQGQALFASATRIYGGNNSTANAWPAAMPAFGHLSPVFGILMRKLNISREKSTRLFLFWHLRGWLAGAVRLGIIGPLEAQSMQIGLGNFAEEMRERHSDLDADDVAQTAPLIDLWQGAQDRLYSRLFQS